MHLVEILHVIIGGSVECGTNTQLVNGPYNNTHLEVVTSTASFLIRLEVISGITQSGAAIVKAIVIDHSIVEVLTIVLIAVEVKVGDTKVDTPVHCVLEVTTQGDVVLVGVAFLVNIVVGRACCSVGSKTLQGAIAVGVEKIRLIGEYTQPWGIAVVVDIAAVVRLRKAL